ncbi:MAG: hypothetical protein AB1497_08350 [Bacillota bacterium]
MSFLRLTRTTVVFVVVNLFVIELALGVTVPGMCTGSSVRSLKRDPAGLSAIVERIRVTSGPSVAFIGDSQMYGSAVKDEALTIPGYFSALVGEDISVYNLGMKGYGPGECAYVADLLAGSGVDLVIYNLSLGWLTREEPVVVPDIDHLLQTGTASWQAARTMSPLSKAKLFIRQRWKLLAHRNMIREQLFGMVGLRDPFSGPEDPELYLPWYDSHFDPGMIPVFGRFKVVPSNLEMLETAVRRMTDAGITVFVFTSPQNRALYEQFAGWDEDGTNSIISLVSLRVMAAGGLFADYTALVSPDLFSDSIHLLAEGHRQVAEALFYDIGHLIKKGS